MTDIKSVLITGGAGFIGSNLASRLLKLGYKVIILDDLSRGDPNNIRDCYNYAPRFNFIMGSVLDYELVERIVSKVDIVFHLAAQVHWEDSINEPIPSFQINTIGTLNLLEAVKMNLTKRNPVKLMMYASSSEVYGTAQYIPMDEKHPFNPQSPYAAGKASADLLCGSYALIYKIPVVRLRQFNTYGPRQKTSGYSAVIPKFINQVLSGRPPTIYGSGEQTKDFHYIDDLINAYVLILENWDEMDLIGQAINFGTGIETSINRLAEIIIKKAGRTDIKPIHLAPRTGEVMQFQADIGLARKLLKFEPKIHLNEGIIMYMKWFNEHKSVNLTRA